MAIQISGSTIINNSKQIQNIGGTGGIISGSVTVSGAGGSPSNPVNKYVTITGVYGMVLMYGGWDIDDSSMGGYVPVYGVYAGAPFSTSTWYTSTIDESGSNNNVGLYVNDSIASSPLRVGFWLGNGTGVSKTFYYNFSYSGTGTAAISIT